VPRDISEPFACWRARPQSPENLTSFGATHHVVMLLKAFLWSVKIKSDIRIDFPVHGDLFMFSKNELAIDSKYFDIIDVSAFCVTLRSKNTGHYWHIENADGANYRSCNIFHRHNESDSYHLHGHSGTFNQCIIQIKEHDRFQLSCLLLTAPFVRKHSVSAVRKLSVCMPTPFPEST